MFIQVEDTHGVGAVVQVATPYLHPVFHHILMCLMSEDILIYGIHLVVAQEIKGANIDALEEVVMNDSNHIWSEFFTKNVKERI